MTSSYSCYYGITIIIPPYGSTGEFSLLYVCFLFVCTVTDFSAAEKDRGMKFCMGVPLLSGQVFSHFGENGLGVTAAVLLPGWMHRRTGAPRRLPARLGGQSELGAVAQRGTRNCGRHCVRLYGGICILCKLAYRRKMNQQFLWKQIYQYSDMPDAM